MPILHDNRNMRPDLLDNPIEQVDEIFAVADAQMESQRKKQTFTPSPKKQWKKRIKRIFRVTFFLTVLVLIVVGVVAVRYTYKTVVSEMQSQVISEVHDLQVSLSTKDPETLTEEDLLLLEIFKIISEEDIEHIIQSATSVEELIQIMQTSQLDFNKYLSPEKQAQLETLFLEYAQRIEKRLEEECTESQPTETNEAVQKSDCTTEE